jgi:hypothetical protein
MRTARLSTLVWLSDDRRCSFFWGLYNFFAGKKNQFSYFEYFLHRSLFPNMNNGFFIYCHVVIEHLLPYHRLFSLNESFSA